MYSAQWTVLNRQKDAIKVTKYTKMNNKINYIKSNVA